MRKNDFLAEQTIFCKCCRDTCVPPSGMHDAQKLLDEMLAGMPGGEHSSPLRRSPRKRSASAPPAQSKQANAFTKLKDGAKAVAKQSKLAAAKKSTAMKRTQRDTSHAYNVLRLVTVFDPSIATEKLTVEWVEEMEEITPFKYHDLIPGLVAEFSTYKAKAQGCTFNRTDIPQYTKAILLWWANHRAELPAWAHAARIAFAFSPNSACCERVFSLLKLFFGHYQDSSLADYVEGSLMVRYNGRAVG